MSGSFIAFIVFAILAILITIAWRITKQKLGDSYYGWWGLVPLAVGVVALGLLIASCFTQVATRDIGIVTSFGRPVSHLDNGVHFVAPWEKVSTLDGAIQTDNYVGTKECTDIRIGNQSTACIDNSIRWRIKPEAGDTLFRDYHTMKNIQDSLVTRELKAALNAQLASYNPLSDIGDSGTPTTPNLADIAGKVKGQMVQEIGDQIDVLSVIIPIIRYDQPTQDKLNAYQQQVAQTRIAEQGILTAEAEAKANEVLAQSVSKDPNVLVSKCLDMVKSGANLPAGFSCWPSGSSAVVVPSAPSK